MQSLAVKLVLQTSLGFSRLHFRSSLVVFRAMSQYYPLLYVLISQDCQEDAWCMPRCSQPVGTPLLYLPTLVSDHLYMSLPHRMYHEMLSLNKGESPRYF